AAASLFIHEPHGKSNGNVSIRVRVLAEPPFFDILKYFRIEGGMVNGALFADDAGVPDRALGGNQDANGQVSLEYGSFSQEFPVQEFQLALIVFDGSEYGFLAEGIGDDFGVGRSGADVPL